VPSSSDIVKLWLIY